MSREPVLVSEATRIRQAFALSAVNDYAAHMNPSLFFSVIMLVFLFPRCHQGMAPV